MTSLLARPDVLDQFGRTVASGWGTADTGQAWAVSSSGLTSVGSGLGVMDPAAANTSVSAGQVATYPDFEIGATCYLPETPSGAAMNAYLLGRADGASGFGSNRYEVLAGFTTGGTVTVTLRSVVAGSGSNLATLMNSVAYTPGTGLNMRLRCVGSTIQAKAWYVGTTEPAWSSVVNTSITSGPFVGLGLFRNAGNTSTDDRLLWDNFSCRALYPNVRDSFGRSVGDSWGTSTSGHSWLILAGTASDYFVAAGQGWIAANTLNSTYQISQVFAHQDVDMVCDLGVQGVQAGANAILAVAARASSGGTTHYRVSATFDTAGTVTFSIVRSVSGTASTLVSAFASFSYQAGEMFRIRLQCVGPLIRAKAWPVGDPEPDDWASGTDTEIANGARVAVQAFRASGNTTTDFAAMFDNFFVRPLRPAINDAFDRTVASGWGNLTSGQAWINSNTSKMSVGSGRGMLSADANTSLLAAIPAPSPDVEVRAVVDFAQVQTGASNSFTVAARAANSSTGGDRYRISGEFFPTTGTLTVNLAKTATSGTNLATLFNATYTPGTGLNVRLRCVGSRIMGKAWLVGQSEPAWSEVQDTSLTTAGFVRCEQFRASGNTSTDPFVYYDDFQVIDLSRPLRIDTGATMLDRARLVAV